jgi:hypothetical protein
MESIDFDFLLLFLPKAKAPNLFYCNIEVLSSQKVSFARFKSTNLDRCWAVSRVKNDFVNHTIAAA